MSDAALNEKEGASLLYCISFLLCRLPCALPLAAPATLHAQELRLDGRGAQMNRARNPEKIGNKFRGKG